MPKASPKDVTEKTFEQLGNKYARPKGTVGSVTPHRKMQLFKATFEVTPTVCFIIWNKICDKGPADLRPIHLLWGLAFLKQYTNENDRQSVFKSDHKTMRKWIFVVVDLLSNLNVIVWENRKQKSVAGQTAFCSLDSVDLKVKEPTKSPNPKWHSTKLRAPGLRYEIGLAIQTGHIVWKNSGYPCGDSSEIALALESYTLAVEPGEKTFAKKQYRNEKFFISPNENNKSEHSRIMARHSALCSRLKRFQVLKQPFRHDLEKHADVFNAVINVIQLMLENGEPLGDVDCAIELDKLEKGDTISAEEVWIKTEPSDDIVSMDHSNMNDNSAGICIKTEPVDEMNSECIKSEITLGDYECIPTTYQTAVNDV